MAAEIIKVSRDFWNIRGSFRVGGLLDVGTHASLVRRSTGAFVLLDAYTFSDDVAGAIDERTGGGRDLEAILNLHPFHTLHVEYVHRRYPAAALYGTARHLARFPRLPWAETRTEDRALHEQYADDFEFSVPRGVDFIPANEHLHFSSVLALHRASGTIHSDDTLMYLALPGLLRFFSLGDAVSFHPTLSRVLQRRAGAAREFRDWAAGLIDGWRDAENLCAAHTGALLARDNDGESLYRRLQRALDKVQGVLRTHERRYG